MLSRGNRRPGSDAGSNRLIAQYVVAGCAQKGHMVVNFRTGSPGLLCFLRCRAACQRDPAPCVCFLEEGERRVCAGFWSVARLIWGHALSTQMDATGGWSVFPLLIRQTHAGCVPDWGAMPACVDELARKSSTARVRISTPIGSASSSILKRG